MPCQHKKKLLATLLVSTVAALSAMSAHAQTACATPNTSNYGLSVSVAGGSCSAVSTDTVEQFLDKLSNTGLRSVDLSYNGTQPATIGANFNSLGMTISYPNTGFTGTGAALTLSIPGLGVSQQFLGADRDASKELMADYLKKTNIIGRIMKYQAANSPTSPITGAGGLMPSMVAGDFNQNFTDMATNIAGPASQASAASQNNVTPNLIGVALSYSSLTALGRDTTAISMPFSYTIRNNLDPRRQLVLSLPITQVDTAGAKSYQTGLGAAYRLPMNDSWTLTPSGRVSVVGSKDLATVAGLYSLSLTSTYIWALPDFDVAMGNMISYNQTMKFKSGDYSFDPDIQSTVLRNGVMLSQPVSVGGKKMSVEYSFIDTRYTGSDFYVDNTQEIGITLGTNKRAYSSRSFFRAGLSYIHGKDMDGFTLNAGYWF